MYQAEIETTIAGIPCLIGVTHYECVRGSYNYNAASDVDYYGSCSWVVLDRRGRAAPWLERKLNREECRRIDGEVAEYFKDLRDQSRIDAWEANRYN